MSIGSADAFAPTSPVAAPLNPQERIEAIDALRGLALFGVLMVNLITEFRVSIFAQFLPSPAIGGFGDRVVSGFVSAGLEMKAFSLFSLLFGVGLAIQFERLAHRKDRAVLLLRRISVLLAFGLVHLFLIWNGDILTEYAVAGFVVLPLLYAPTGVLAATAVAALTFFAAMPLLHVPIPFPSQAWIVHHVAAANSVFGSGSYPQIEMFNIAEVPTLAPLHLSVFPRTVGLFALGMWLWRARFFGEKLGVFALSTALVALPLGIALTANDLWLAGSPLTSAANRLAPVAVALGYAGVILWLATGERRRALVMWAAPLGRMAFTNYVAQSVIFGWIFYGYGLGQFGRLAPLPTFSLGLLIYAAQAMASTWWLRRFLYGPLEWLWRTLMYGRLQRMHRGGSATTERATA
jgi:uncharacterized protein